jgi:hypothetical protein
VKRPKPFSSYTALICDLLDEEPTCSEEAIQRKEWADAMTEEYQCYRTVCSLGHRLKDRDQTGVTGTFPTQCHLDGEALSV